MGVLWGLGPGGCDKGIFGKSWGCHSEAEMERMYDKLVELLASDDPFVTFDTLTFLIGEKNAGYFCRKHLNVHYRPPPVKSTSNDGLD